MTLYQLLTLIALWTSTTVGAVLLTTPQVYIAAVIATLFLCFLWGDA